MHCTTAWQQHGAVSLDQSQDTSHHTQHATRSGHTLELSARKPRGTKTQHCLARSAHTARFKQNNTDCPGGLKLSVVHHASNTRTHAALCMWTQSQGISPYKPNIRATLLGPPRATCTQLTDPNHAPDPPTPRHHWLPQTPDIHSFRRCSQSHQHNLPHLPQQPGTHPTLEDFAYTPQRQPCVKPLTAPGRCCSCGSCGCCCCSTGQRSLPKQQISSQSQQLLWQQPSKALALGAPAPRLGWSIIPLLRWGPTGL